MIILSIQKITKSVLYGGFKKYFYYCYTLFYIVVIATSLPRWNSFYIKELSLIKFSTAYFEYKKELKSLFSFSKSLPLLNVKRTANSEQETHVVIVGESTSSCHMELYGYHRANNPKLKSIKDELIIFTNTNTNYVTTTESLKNVFLLKDTNNTITNITLIDCLNEANLTNLLVK